MATQVYLLTHFSLFLMHFGLFFFKIMPQKMKSPMADLQLDHSPTLILKAQALFV